MVLSLQSNPYQRSSPILRFPSQRRCQRMASDSTRANGTVELFQASIIGSGIRWSTLASSRRHKTEIASQLSWQTDTQQAATAARRGIIRVPSRLIRRNILHLCFLDQNCTHRSVHSGHRYRSTQSWRSRRSHSHLQSRCIWSLFIASQHARPSQ